MTDMTATKTLRAATFARVSSEDQAVEGKASLPAQLEATRRYVESVLGGEVVAEFVEEGVSGALEYRQRPEIARLLTMAETGGLDAVVWAYADRQGRSVVEVTLIEQELRKHGVEVHLVEGGKRDRQSADGVLVEGVRDLVAEAERIRIKQRMATGRYMGAMVGRWTNGIPPTGYETTADRRLVVCENEAEYVRFAFARIVAGDSIEAATRALNARWPEYRGKRGGVGFTNSAVGRWVRNRLYVGDGASVTISPAPGQDREPFSIPAPALVSAETFEDAQKNLSRSVAAWRKSTKRSRKPATPKKAYALSGGRLVHVHASGGAAPFFGMARAGLRRYRCSHSVTRYTTRWAGQPDFDPCDGFGQHPVKKAVKLTALRASEVEALVLLDVVGFVSRPEAIAEAREREARRGEAVAETIDTLDHALAEREALAKERSNLVRRLGRLTDAEADAALDDIEARQRENGERIARLENQSAYLESLRLSVDDILSQSVSILGVTPGDETVSDVDEENGLTVVHALGWDELLAGLRTEAKDVLAGALEDLQRATVEWLSYMVDAWDLRVEVRDLGETYGVTVLGLPDPSAAANAQRNGSARRRPR